FHRVLETATERLEISWSLAGNDNRERNASPFVHEVQRLLPDAPVTRPRTGLYPEATQAATVRELFACAFDASHALHPAAASLDESLFERVKRGSGIERDRYGYDKFGAFDGVLATPSHRQALAERFGPHHVWSARQFEAYLACPLQFFVEY